MARFLPSASSLGRLCRHSFLSCLFFVLALLPLAGWGQSIKFDNQWNGDVYCQASSIYVSFQTTGTFNSNNVFIVEVSDANGSFTSPTQIASGNPTPFKTGWRAFSCPLSSCSSGSGRYIRVRSTSPARTSTSSPAVYGVPQYFSIVSTGQITADFPTDTLPLDVFFTIPLYSNCGTPPGSPTFWLSDTTGNFGSNAINITSYGGDGYRKGQKKPSMDTVANEPIPYINEVGAIVYRSDYKSCSRYRIKVTYDNAAYSPATSDYYYTPIGSPTLTAATTGYAGATFSGTLSLPCLLPSNAGHINIFLSDSSGSAGFVQRATLSTLNGGSFSFTIPTNTLTGKHYKLQAMTDVSGLWTWTSGNISILTPTISINAPTILATQYPASLTFSTNFTLLTNDSLRVEFSDTLGNFGANSTFSKPCTISGSTASFMVPSILKAGKYYSIRLRSEYYPMATSVSLLNLHVLGTVAITFQVDMANTPASGTVYIAGNFNNFSSIANPLTLITGSVWQAIITLPQTSAITYKFVNGISYEADIPTNNSCNNGTGTNGFRTYTVGQTSASVALTCFGSCGACPPKHPVTFLVNMQQQVAPSSVKMVINYTNSVVFYPMTFLSGTTYSTTVNLIEGQGYTYKFVKNNITYEADIPAGSCNPGGAGGNYRYYMVTSDAAATVPVVCFGQCVNCPPKIILSSDNPASVSEILPRDLFKGIAYAFNLQISDGPVALHGLSFTTTGTMNSSDIYEFQLYSNSTNSLIGASKIGDDITSSLGAGAHQFSNLSTTLTDGTVYFFITLSTTHTPTAANSLTIQSISTNDINLGSGSISGSTSNGGSQTINDPSVYTSPPCRDFSTPQSDFTRTNPTNPHAYNAQNAPWKINSFDWTTDWYNNRISGIAGQIQNPYSNDNAYYEKIYQADPAKRDYYPEDGWELVKRDMGYLMNPTPTPNTYETQYISYLLLYNKYTGVLRVFATPVVPASTVQNIKVVLRFKTESSAKVSTLLAGASNNPPLLSEPTKIGSQTAFVGHPQASNAFFYADFPMSYDPCTCHNSSELIIQFTNISTSELTAQGGSFGVTESLLKYREDHPNNPDYSQEFFNSILSGDGSSGAFMNGKIDDLATIYKNDLISYQNSQKLSDSWDGLARVLDIGSTETELCDESDKGCKAAGTYLKLASETADLISVSTKSDEQSPTMPMVVEENVKLTGTVTSFTPSVLSTISFSNPGSQSSDASPEFGGIDPNPARPTYNETMGLIAFKKHPIASFFYDHYQTFSGSVITEHMDRFLNVVDVDYFLNPAAGIDLEKTSVTASIFITTDKYPEFGSPPENFTDDLSEFKYSEIDPGNGRVTYVSKFIPLTCLGHYTPYLSTTWSYADFNQAPPFTLLPAC